MQRARGVRVLQEDQWAGEATTRFNVLDRYGTDKVSQFTEFDPKSIMVYAIPKELTLDGFEVRSNTSLSDTDKKFIGTVYPF